MDIDLRNGLWDVFKASVLDVAPKYRDKFEKVSPFHELCKILWHMFYKEPMDKVPEDWKAETYIRNEFFSCQWFEVYNLLEFAIVLSSIPIKKVDIEPNIYKENCNSILEREFSGYRFVGDQIAPVTNEHEGNEIQFALDQTQTFTALVGCNIHLRAALTLLSDKQRPDYRNSIKESISAIESIAKIISGNTKDTLGTALDKIKGSINLHSALEKGFKQIYGYTSDSGGIRHALMESTDCDFEDAKYMLVSCSAFINYLIVKAEKGGITFDKI